MIKRIFFLALFLLALAAAAQAGFIAGSNSLTTTAESLATGAALMVVIQADPDNTVDVMLGDATSQPVQLTPGQSATIIGTALSDIYVKAASGTATVNYWAKQ